MLDVIAEGSVRQSGVMATRMSRMALTLLVSLGLLLLLPVVASQSGFISIDCGSTSNYTDSAGIVWSTDDGYVSTGQNQKASVLFNPASGNKLQLSTARTFEVQGRKKNCYVLPAQTNNSYLIRAFFLSAEISLALEYSFSLSIDCTIVESITVTPLTFLKSQYFEYLVTATKAHIDFCLIPDTGNAYISSLELRPLLSTMYMGLAPSKYATLVNRMNAGAAATDPVLRFPDDKFDRLWLPPSSSYPFASVGTKSTTSTSGSKNMTATRDQPPSAIMQTAWEDTDISFRWTLSSDANSGYYVALYFQEVETPENATAVRSVDVLLNGATLSKGIVIKSSPVEIYENNYQIPGTVANFTLISSRTSTLPPLLNGAELYALYPAITVTTATADVIALADLQKSLYLTDWTGDPCLPVSWDWVNCSTTSDSTTTNLAASSNSSSPRVTQLNLSGYRVSGKIPASIANMSALTDVWLDNNLLTGTIPNMAGLTRLKTLHLSDNLLTGTIPASLASIPSLSQLYLDGNNLDGPVPAALLSKKGLDLRIDASVNTSTPSPTPSPSPSPVPSPSLTPSISPSISPSTPPIPPPTGSNPAPAKKKSSNNAALIGAIIGVIAVAIIAICAAVVLLICCRRRKAAGKSRPLSKSTPIVKIAREQSLSGTRLMSQYSDLSKSFGNNQRSFSQIQVQDATNNFKWKIGEGGFGPVYYGRLASGEEVAVKVKSTADGQGIGSDEFSTEVALLSVVHHRNLVSLIGFCDEGDQQILVYEYMPKGTLREHLYGKGFYEMLTWPARLNIALDAARGLEYLHHDCSPKIIHRDVKSTNILLSEKLLAKMADFGISKTAPDEDNTKGFTTVVRGTTGYFDPEYFTTNKLNQKSDVYAFGVVLLEIICGRPPNDSRLEDNPQSNLVSFARGVMRAGDLERIVDPALGGTYNMEAMWKLAELAMYCVEPSSTNRPDMRQVVRELIDTKGLENMHESSGSANFTSVARSGFTSSLEDTTGSLNSFASISESSSRLPPPPLHIRQGSNGSIFGSKKSDSRSPRAPPRSFLPVPGGATPNNWNKPQAR